MRHRKTGEEYHLQSESIGKLLGYLSNSLEEGFRPSPVWSVAFRHRSGKVFQLWPAWPDENDPVGQLADMAVSIDAKLVRARSEPDFFKVEDGRRQKLSLHSEVDGRRLLDMSIDERIRLAEKGREGSMSVFELLRLVLSEPYDPSRANEVMIIKENPPR